MMILAILLLVNNTTKSHKNDEASDHTDAANKGEKAEREGGR